MLSHTFTNNATVFLFNTRFNCVYYGLKCCVNWEIRKTTLQEEIFPIALSASGSAAQLSAGGEDVAAFAFAQHSGEMFIEQNLLKRFCIFTEIDLNSDPEYAL